MCRLVTLVSIAPMYVHVYSALAVCNALHSYAIVTRAFMCLIYPYSLTLKLCTP